MKNTLKLLLERPYRDVAIFATTGWLLLLVTVCVVIDGTPPEIMEWLRWQEIANAFVFLPLICGGINGGIAGFAVWVCTGRGNPIAMRAIACGLVVGGFLALVPTVIFLSSEHLGGGKRENPIAGLYTVYAGLETLQTNLVLGSAIGSLIGLSFWILLGKLSRHPTSFRPSTPHPFFTAFAGGVISIFLATILFSIFWATDAPSGGGASTMYAVGMSATYFVGVLPGSALFGAIGGLIWGVVRRSRSSPYRM